MKKMVIIVSTVFLILLAAAEFYVRSDSFTRRIRPVVVDRLASALGTDVKIGAVRANLLPLYLEARDVALPDGQGKPAAALRRIKIYINPLQLVLKTVSISSITLREPSLFLDRSKDSTYNVTPIIERIRGNIARMQTGESTGLRIVLRNITLSQGRIYFKDELTSTVAEISGIRMTVSADAADGFVRVALKNADLRVSAPAYPVLAGSLKASLWYEHGLFHLESSELTTADTGISLNGEAGYLPDAPLNLRLKIRSGPQTLGTFSRLFKSAEKERGPNIEAAAVIRGSRAKPAVDGSARFSGFSYHGIRLQDAKISFGYADRSLTLSGDRLKLVRGHASILINRINAAFGYSDHGLDIRNLELLAEDLSFRMSGRTDPQRGFDATLAVQSEARGRTLSFLTAVPLEGQIGIKGSLTGALNAPLFDGVITAESLNIRGVLFEKAEGRIRYRDKTISMIAADIHQQTSRYLLDASIDMKDIRPLFAARLKVIRAEVGNIVALFYKPIPLHIPSTGELTFHGTTEDFSGSGRLEVEAGSAYGESLAMGTITASLTKDKIIFPHVSVKKGSGSAQGAGWIGFDGTYSAEIRSSGMKLSEVDHLAGIPVDGFFDLAVESSGSFSHPTVSSTLEMHDLLYRQASLGGISAELTIEDGALACRARFADDRVNATARLGLSKPYGWSVQAAVDAEGFDPFVALNKRELLGRASMTMKGDLVVRGTGADIGSLSGTVTFHRIGLVMGDYRIDNDGDVVMTARSGRMSVARAEFSGAGTKIAVTGGSQLMKDFDLSFSGVAQLSLLRILFREVEHADGTAEMKLSVRDAWNNPDVTGELRISRGEIKIQDIPQKFSSLQGHLTFSRDRIVVDTLTGEVGGGKLKSSGWVQLSGIALRDFSMNASFENVTVRYPEGLTSTLSGELYYDGNATEQSLTGDVTIGRARYEKRVEWKSMLVDFGKGIYQRKKTEVAWIGDTQINIGFHGSNNIVLQNNLAVMPLNVEVFLRGTVNHPQLLGRVEALKGKVYFRKNEFTILHASADFVDPNRMNPILDIQAEITVRDIDQEYRIRLAVSGSADRAVVTLLSDPSLPDSDILALLALGKTSAELKGRESEVGMSEAASFATGQFQDMVESRARSLTGLDRFQVDPYVSKSDTSVPRVTVGKEIVQNKVYVTYSSNVGSTTPDQIFRIEYILNKHFSLVGERNEIGNTGADLKYRFEFK